MSALQDVTARGIRLAYRVTGAVDAPPMVLLHGLGEQSASWAAVTGPFADRFRVFAFDMRGHGASDWPGAYSFELMRDDVLGALDTLALEKITLVGHSMGAGVAYLVAIHQPSRVERLIVEDAPPPFPRDRAVPERPDGPVDFDWSAAPAIIGQVNRGDPVTWERLREITAPTLVIGGGPESHIPQEKLTEVAARIPRCDVVTIPAGHHVHDTRPAEFASAVLGWLPA